MRSMCSRATAARSSAICAISPTPSSPSFKTPMAQAQIGAALAMLGDRARAGKVFAAALDCARRGKGQRPVAARLRLAAARRRGRARADRRGQSDQRRACRRSDRPRGRGRRSRRATRAATRARRRTTGSRSPPRRSPSTERSARSASTASRSTARSIGNGAPTRSATRSRRSPMPAHRPRASSPRSPARRSTPAPARGAGLRGRAHVLQARRHARPTLKRHAERPRRRRAEDHRDRGAIRAAAGRRPPARGARDRQSRPVRQRLDRRASPG